MRFALIMVSAGFFTLRADELPLLTVPVRVHLLHSEQEAALNTTLTEADVARIFGKVNNIWAQAGIRFEVESAAVTHMLAGGRAMPKERLLKNGINVSYVKNLEENGFWTGATGSNFAARARAVLISLSFSEKPGVPEALRFVTSSRCSSPSA